MLLKKTKWLFIIVSTAIINLCLSGCKPVKDYQRVYLNDAEMDLSSRKIEKSEMNFLLYREGSSGANGGKTGGGCGCN